MFSFHFYSFRTKYNNFIKIIVTSANIYNFSYTARNLEGSHYNRVKYSLILFIEFFTDNSAWDVGKLLGITNIQLSFFDFCFFVRPSIFFLSCFFPFSLNFFIFCCFPFFSSFLTRSSFFIRFCICL